MAKFTIECPHCSSINQASTFIFAKNKIQCGSCGNEIDIKRSRLISKICPGCGKSIVCDQAKLKGKRCPACGTDISVLTATAEYKGVVLHCPQCSCQVEVDKTKPLANCPICAHQFDVKAEIAKNALGHDTISVIKYEGDNNTFIWKHPVEDFSLGSQLIVHQNQEAIFFVNGEALDTFPAGRHTLETENIPMLRKILKVPTDGPNPFHAEVYFINLTHQMAIKWGTPDRVRFTDPETKMPLDIGASGEMTLAVKDSRKLLEKLVGTMAGIDWAGAGKGFTQSLKQSFRGIMISAVKSYLAAAITQTKDEEGNPISIFDLDREIDKWSLALRDKISPKFEEYGLYLPGFVVTNISLPEDNEAFVRLREQRNKEYLGVRDEEIRAKIAEAEQKRRMTEATTEANLKRIAASGDADVTRMQGFAEAEVMRAKGYTHKDEIDAEVQKAFAAGMGQFGANGGSGGGGGGGVASDMMNMMMGMRVAGMMTGQLDNAFNPSAGNPVGGSAPAQQAPAADGWTCECGASGIQSKFCPECGKPKPAPAELWDCTCGCKGVKSKFCPECGKPKPVPPQPWDCSCGCKGITSKFCPECGKPKPAFWDCECGAKNIAGKFCPDCGKARD